ncbi:virulence factor Mce family protein [Mycobacterium celatum]|uniref:Mammalian cell entry protein n=1 Tax=Mycobacterium celatum TaxID=28045 RepID=A0A1X1RQK0_MYCCE|nr:virulence factor Mce family protein [Mycobacterium celatum]ORV11289.1 mammalian cell entry protein [Mycobacterium celatum]PIB79223.1 virulence factor Mce family protein [Mycobacterium celatum]
MLDRLTRAQLTIFGVVTVITVAVMAIFYLRLPAALGVGTYQVTADFVAGGGLYKNANVTYRGVAVGRVESVGLNPNGVDAVMRLNSGTAVPSNVTATVKSVSAIGEQYVDLVPPDSPAATKLHNGSRIARDNTRIPLDIATLLRQSETLVNSVADTRLRELLHETFKAFNGSGPELARLIESSRLLVDEANAYFPQTSQLVDQVGPFLQAQIRAGDDIKSLSDGLARFTSEVRQADPQLRQLLAVVPPAADEANTAFSGIRPSFPMLAASLANLGRVGVIYHKSLEHLLVVLPALFAAITTAAGGEPQDEGAKLDFKINIDPPPCNTGFIPPPLIRTPADETVREIPTDMYCKTAQNDPSTVRGARNYPCQEFPGKRAPTVALCRDPRGYVPIGTNPWRGPPIPYDTPVTNGLNILPPNKFPYIPPGADPDPGTPIVGPPPPGVVPGPGPAPNQPFPTPPPPNTGGTDGRQAWIPPAPYPPQPPMIPFPKAVPPPPPPEGLSPPPPFPPPEKPWGPPPGPVPQASGAAYTTYDESTGAFQDPAGGTGIFAPGRSSSAETWVDLMRDPRQL